jgi:HK97 family phage major capsid protein
MSNRLQYAAANYMRYGRLTAFPNEERAFRAGAWFLAMNGNAKARAWCEQNGLAVTRSQSEGVNSAGGVLVPDELMRTIIALREERGAFRASARIVPMNDDTATIPRRAGGLTAYFTAESMAITESQNVWGSVGLTTKKLATLTRSSSELDEDAAIDIGEWFIKEISYAFVSAEDSAGFNGDGTSTFGGMTGVTVKLIDGTHTAGALTAASGHDTFAEIDINDLTNLMGKLPAYALPCAKWFSSQMGFATVFCRLAATAGGIIMQNVNGRWVPTFMGFPVQISQVLPQVTTDLSGSVMLMFGDLSLATTLGERRGVTVARSEGRYLDQDQIAWRGTERVDIVVHDLGDNTTAGPVVGLVGE